MKFFSNKISLQDAPKSFGDLCKEALSAKNDNMTKVAHSEGEVAEDVTENIAEASEGEDQQALPEELQAAIDEVRSEEVADQNEDVFASDSSEEVLKVASINTNEDGTVTVEFDKEAAIGTELCEDCQESKPCRCEDEDASGDDDIEEACSYSSDYGKFIKVSNLTSNQKDYFKNYWDSVWPKEFIDALLIDQ